MAEPPPQTFVDDHGVVRLRDTEFTLPVIVGTCAFWLGKKASEFQSHRWTVFLRTKNNEDITHVIQKVTFELHHTFNNPNRMMEAHPFEVTEHGWGEFDIGITLHFAPDSCEPPFTLHHHLKLYESENQAQTTKKPVVSETYDELVFSEPAAAFYARVSQVPMTPATPLSVQAHLALQEEEELLAKLSSCRARAAAMVSELRKDFDTLGRG